MAENNDYIDEFNDTTGMKKANIIITIILLILVYIFVCYFLYFGYSGSKEIDNTVTENSIIDVLDENGYPKDSYTVEKTIDLPKEIIGLEYNDNNKLLMMRSGEQYFYIVINTEQETIYVPECDYTPLKDVLYQIYTSDKDTNSKYIETYKDHIVNYGFDFMETKIYAKEFLRELTDKDIISVDGAQNAIVISAFEMFPEITSKKDFAVVFEADSAVPTHYATVSKELAYNWSSLWPEYQYEFVVDSLSRENLTNIARVYGPAYCEKSIWIIFDDDLREVGKCNSLKEIKSKYKDETLKIFKQ